MSDVGGVLLHQRRRVVEIVDVFARYGFTQLASAFGAATGDEPSRFPLHRAGLRIAGFADPELVALTTGERLRAALAELGTTWVKLGQMLSLRADIVGADIAAALRGLQSSVPADAPGLATATVETELGQAVGRAVRDLLRRAAGLGLGRAGARGDAARRHRGRGQGAAPRRRPQGHAATSS